MRTIFFSLAFLAACGPPVGKAGVPLDTPLSDLTADEWQAMCEWIASTAPAEEVTTECDGYSVTSGAVDVDECLESSELAYDGCSATVESLEACTDAINADPCNGLDDPNCASILLCALSAG